ncbi:MAG: DUF2867 domain-containing protein [Pseudomonadota bacterium]
MSAPAVIEADLPAVSMLHERIAPGDFLDCYAVDAGLSPRQAATVITAFPGWARALLRLRYWLTAPFGLLQDGPPASDKIGVFPVEAEASNEIIAGFNDRHLDFRISVLSDHGRIFLGTWVHPHNLGGRLYLKAIMPFHILIARNALSRVAAHTGAASGRRG